MSDAKLGLWDRGRARWPGFSVERSVFEQAVDDAAEVDHPEDLYLALGCVARMPEAVRAFRDEHASALVGFARTVLREGGAADELGAQLLVDMLVGDETGPRLANYSGRGPLRAWLRMSTVRRALNAKRNTTRRQELDGKLLAEAVDGATDPETALLKDQYGAVFEQSFREAVQELAAPLRTLLRLHYGEGLGLGALAAMNGWSKPTASRRVAEARAAVLARTVELMTERAGIGQSQLQSVLRLVQSGLDMSMTSLFATKASPG
ncbi:MAG: hypothetical protein JNL83_22435 [Myxococcales bacterium]|nr:hypothetical protein [Myxococcales bacterium]